MSQTHLPDRLPDVLPPDPMALAYDWFQAAQEGAAERNPNAMTLATLDAGGQPTARVVLCKAFIAKPGYLVFYTNYRSDKGRQLAADPRVGAVFHWDAPGRQIRLEGLAVKSPADESDAYFASRDWGSQVGAWGSDQSRPIQSRDALIAQVRTRAADLGIMLGADTATLAVEEPPPIGRPPYWGGYRIWPHAIELWVEGSSRIHDRARFTRELVAQGAHAFTAGRWSGIRLQP